MQASDVAFAGIAAQAAMIARGEISSRELTHLYLRRIDHYDGELNAFRIVFEEQALAEASRADELRAAGEQRQLLGVPIAIKDDMDVAGVVTAYGSNAQEAPAAA